jgi:hypothetical protein
MHINAPKLERVDSDLLVAGLDMRSGFPFPILHTVGGKLDVRLTGLASFPECIEHLGGHFIFSDLDPESMRESAREAKRRGVIKGEIFCVITP